MSISSNLLLKIGLVLGAGYLGVKAYEKKLLPIGPSSTPIPQADPKPKPQPTTKAKTPVPLSEFPLKRGSRGEYVKALQTHLGVASDGVFGLVTEAALSQRYGKKQILTLSELTTLLNTGTSLPVKPGTSPSLPKPTSAIPSQTPSDYQQKLTAQMWTVFNAIWSKTGGSSIYTQNLFGKWEAILPVLKPMPDAELKGFMNAYQRSFKGLSFPKSVNRTGTLLGDLTRINKTRANVAYFTQVDRVKKLS